MEDKVTGLEVSGDEQPPAADPRRADGPGVLLLAEGALQVGTQEVLGALAHHAGGTVQSNGWADKWYAHARELAAVSLSESDELYIT